MNGRPRLKGRNILSPLAFCLLAGMALGSAPAALAVETVYSPAGSQDPLDNIGGGTRAMGMGGAFAGVADDDTALLWNPAGLSTLTAAQVSLNHNSWLVGTDQEVLTAVLPTNLGGMGLAVNYAGYGSMDGRDSLGFSTGSYGANQFGLGLGWGKRVLGDLAVGLSFLAESQNLGGNSYSLLGGDGGLLLKTRDGWGAGLSFENLGLGPTSSAFASAARLGLSKLWKDRAGTSFLAALGGKLEPNGGSLLQSGAEFTYHSVIMVRAGYGQSLGTNDLGGLQGLTLGAGLAWSSFRLDYAFIPYGELGNANMVSVGYVFENPKPRAASRPAPAAPSPLPLSIPSSNPQPPVPAMASPAQPAPVLPQAAPQVAPQAVGPEEGDKRTIIMEFEVPASDALTKAKTQEASGQYADAVSTLRADLTANPSDAPAWRELGNLYFRASHKESAIYCYETFLRLKPDQALSDWLANYKAKP